MRLYIIRHGQTEWNQTFQVQGRTDIPLNESGRALAKKTGAALADVPFDAAYTSPLIRAQETARIVLEAAAEARSGPGTGSASGTDSADGSGGRQAAADGAVPPVFVDERLTEISFGVMEGSRVRDEAGRLTDENFTRFFYDTKQYLPPEGGESFQSVIARTGAFLEELKRIALRADQSAADQSAADQSPADRSRQAAGVPQTILISTHGCASRALLANITHCPLEDFWDGGVPKNCAVTVVDLIGGEWKIEEKDITYYDNENIGL